MRYNGNSAGDKDKAAAIGAMLLPTVRDLSEHERSQYSLRRAILSLAGECEAGLEHEVSAAIARDIKRATGGLYVPTRLRPGLDTKTDAAGKYTVMTEVRDLIEIQPA